MCERKYQSFFEDLRRLASNIEQGTADIQDKLSQADKGTHSVSAKHQLQTLCKEAKDLKHEVQSQQKHIQSESQNFVSMLTACLNLVKTEMAATESTEEFLAQYGYTTWREHSKCLNDLAAASVSTSSQADRDMRTEPQTTTQSICQSNVSPDACGSSEQCERTPKLEDFTLSSHTMAILAKIRQGECSSFTYGHTQSTATDGYTRYNHEQRNAEQMTPLSQRYGSEQMVSPTPFRHSGIIVTPSLMSGFPMPDLTPCGREGAVYSRDKFASPCPPTFKTPGFKALGKTDVCDLSQPLPGQPVFDDLETAASSPVPPVFITPGVKQIVQNPAEEMTDEGGGGPVKKSCARSANSLFGVKGNTPEAPIFMTPGMKQLPALTDLMMDDSDQTIALENTQTANWQQSSGVNSPKPPVFQARGAKQIYQTHPVRNPEVVKLEADSPLQRGAAVTPRRAELMSEQADLTPQRPELTTRLQPFPGMSSGPRLPASSSVAHTLQHHRKGTPPEPLLICTPDHKFRVQTPPEPALLASKLKHDYETKAHQAPMPPVALAERNALTDLPAPPVFLRKYDFMQPSHGAGGGDENVHV